MGECVDGGLKLKRSGQFIACDMLVKCVGWSLPDKPLKTIFPAFTHR